MLFYFIDKILLRNNSDCTSSGFNWYNETRQGDIAEIYFILLYSDTEVY